MSTRTDWGLFKADGTPVAVGDDWHNYQCRNRVWVVPVYEHPITGEEYDGDGHYESCPFERVGTKKDVCTTCGMQFIYP